MCCEGNYFKKMDIKYPNWYIKRFAYIFVIFEGEKTIFYFFTVLQWCLQLLSPIHCSIYPLMKQVHFFSAESTCNFLSNKSTQDSSCAKVLNLNG